MEAGSNIMMVTVNKERNSSLAEPTGDLYSRKRWLEFVLPTETVRNVLAVLVLVPVVLRQPKIVQMVTTSDGNPEVPLSELNATKSADSSAKLKKCFLKGPFREHRSQIP